MADSAVNHLRREQQDVRRFLTQLKTLLEYVSRSPQWTPEHQESFRQLCRFFEEKLCLLIRKEDQILYPALEGLFPADAGPLAVLRSEHRELCLSFRKVCEIGNSLSEEGTTPAILDQFQRFGRKAAEVLEDHLYKEERVLFPMAARFLTPARDADLLAQMEGLRVGQSM